MTVSRLAVVAAGAVAMLVGSAPARAEPAATESATVSNLALATELRGIGSYSECAVEALRHAHQHPDAREAGFDLAATCLSLAGRFADARRITLSLAGPGRGLAARARLRLCLAEAFMADLDAPLCPSVEARPASAFDPRLDGLAQHTLAMRAINTGRWDEARARLAAAPASADATLAEWRGRDLALAAREQAMPRKSPWTAGVLSAVVPGLGRVYIGRWQDGIISLFLVGVAAGLSAHGFYDEGRDSVRGWILASTASLLYIGNIYGSAVGAMVARRDAEHALKDEVDRDYRARLDP
jgi:hypothetical protein